MLIASISLTGSSRTKQTRLERTRIVQNAFDGGVDYCVDLSQSGVLTLPQAISLSVGNVSESLLVTDYSASIANTSLVTGTLTFATQIYQFSKVIGSVKIYDFTYNSTDGNTAKGTIYCKANGDGTYTVVSGSMTVSASSNPAIVGVYSIYLNPSGFATTSSPSGRFRYNNKLFPVAACTLDTDGLLFTLGSTEINIWGNGSPTTYSFYAAVSSGYNPASDNHGTFVIVPR